MVKKKRSKNTFKKVITLSSISIIAIFMASAYSILSTRINITAKANLYSSDRYLWKQIKNNYLASSGSGFYQTSYESGKYAFVGNGDGNYISIDNDLWRIVSIESDNKIKIVRWSDSYATNFDAANNRTEASDYCLSPQLGCNSFVQQTAFANGEILGTVQNNSTILNYLNGTFYNNLSSDLKSKIVEHEFSIGPVEITEQTTFSNILSQESDYTWTGYIGLLSLTDFIYPSNINTSSSVSGVTFDNNFLTSFATDKVKWTSNPLNNDSSKVWVMNYNKTLANKNANTTSEEINSVTYDYIVLPVVYLKQNVKLLNGNGTQANPFVLE
jgi:hypothetical protein